jgi:recombinational DNA repair ATPase RecF
MKIHDLEITDIRGIRQAKLRPGGANFVIWGPNGSGKSAVVDAIDFLFQGRMARLEGEGTGEISTAKHGFHVDSERSRAVVRASVSLDGIDGTISLARSLATPQVLDFPKEHEEELRPALEVMKSGQYVLTRREILRFITSTGADRAKWIQALLRLDSLEAMRATLVRAAGEAKKQAAAASRTVDAEARSCASLVGLEAWDASRAVGVVNGLRAELGGEPLAALDWESLRSEVTPPQLASKPDVQAARLVDLLAEAGRFQADVAPSLGSKADTLAQSVAELLKSASSVTMLRRRHLIECGLEVIPEDGTCPLCGAEWAPGELAERLAQEFSALSEIATKRGEIDSLATIVASGLVSLRQNISEIGQLAVSLQLVDPESPLQEWARQIDAFSEALQTTTDDVSTLQPLMLRPTIELPPDVVSAMADLHRKTTRLAPGITPSQRAWDTLTRLGDALFRLQTASTASEAAALVTSRADFLLTSYNGAKNDVLTDLYKTVSGRFVALYSQLHRDDGEEGFSAVLEQNDAAVKFLVDFYGRGMFPPHALHSEGHQDSMGICLYLALSEHINKGLVGVTVLDDVVMSVDANHRKSICSVLAKEFKDHQFIITTHDRSWAQQLRSEGVVTGKGMKHFVGWTVESGPRVAEGDIWAGIAKRLSEDDVTSAATLLRSSMEEFFADVCERLWGSVIYRANGNYTLGDYLPAAYHRYRKLLGQAKASANSWSNREAMERLADSESVAKQCYLRTTAEQWVANKGIHFDRWHELCAADLSDVVDAFKDMCAVFVCPACNSVLSVSVSATGAEPEAVRCNCQGVNWNLSLDRSEQQLRLPK